MEPANQPQIETPKPVRHVPAEESCLTDYAAAIRQYHLYGRGRSMRAFCEEEGYSYTKFCYYARQNHLLVSVAYKRNDYRKAREYAGGVIVKGNMEKMAASPLTFAMYRLLKSFRAKISRG